MVCLIDVQSGWPTTGAQSLDPGLPQIRRRQAPKRVIAVDEKDRVLSGGKGHRGGGWLGARQFSASAGQIEVELRARVLGADALGPALMLFDDSVDHGQAQTAGP